MAFVKFFFFALGDEICHTKTKVKQCQNLSKLTNREGVGPAISKVMKKIICLNDVRRCTINLKTSIVSQNICKQVTHNLKITH